MYSPPEPPASTRPPRVLVVLIAVVSFLLVAGGVYLLLPAAGENTAAPSGDREASVGDPKPEPGTFAGLPPPCGTVAATTVRGLIPRAQRRESSNQTLTTCTYSADEFRWLRVEAHLYSPADSATPERDAERYFESQWAQARTSSPARTVSLARRQGMGDAAYRWFRQDRDRPAVVGQVTVRVRNAVITVGYGERANGAARAREDACLDAATRVAGEVLRGFR